MTRNPFVWLVGAFVLMVLASATFFRVPETSQAIIVRLGKPNRIVNAYDAREPFGQTGAGLVAKIPFIETVVFIDKRIMDLDVPQQTVLSTDQLRLVVDAFARFRVTDPLRMYQTVRSETGVADALSRILGSRLRNELGKQPFTALLSPERGQLMDDIQARVNAEAGRYGAEIVDVRIKRVDFVADITDSVYRRMESERKQVANELRSTGTAEGEKIRADADRQREIIIAEAYRDAQKIKGEGDAKASALYAAAFGRDPQFAQFYRSLEAYRATFRNRSDVMVLDPSSEFFRAMRGGGPTPPGR